MLITLAFLLALIGCGENQPAEPQTEKDCVRYQFGIQDQLLQNFASLRSACGNVKNPNDFEVCHYGTRALSMRSDFTCEDIQSMNEAFAGWLGRVAPPLRDACKLDTDCLRWRASYQGRHNGSDPPWWIWTASDGEFTTETFIDDSCDCIMIDGSCIPSDDYIVIDGHRYY